MKREIQIDGDWLDLTVMLLGIALLTGMVFAVVYSLFTGPFEFKSFGGGSIFWVVFWTGLALFFPSTFVRLVFASFALAIAVRGIAQVFVRTPEAMRLAAVSSSVLRILGLSCLLISLLEEVRERVKVVEVTDNA